MISRLLPDPELELCALLFIVALVIVAGDQGAVVIEYGVEKGVKHSGIQPGPHMGLQYGVVVLAVVPVEWTVVAIETGSAVGLTAWVVAIV